MEKINVTQTFLPPLEEYNEYLKVIWGNQWLTNRGELVLELEKKLKDYLKVSNILMMNNGTMPLQIALNNVAQQGEVITTPFSYIASTSSILWEKCTPVFVDIDPEYLTIDETKIEQAITERTTAILAVHIYGNPCNVEAIQNIAEKYKLKVIYDAAHCFGVEYKGKSIFEYGDISTCSFHATKLFHTGEGGAVFCKDDELMHKMFYSHNFGHNGPAEFYGLGINAKISELQGAMGLAVFPYINYIRQERKKVVDFYNNNLNFSKMSTMKMRENTHWNYSYYAVIFETKEILLRVQQALLNQNITPRRYFYPSLNTINYISGNAMPVSESISLRVLCLPLYAGLDVKDTERITKIVNSVV